MVAKRKTSGVRFKLTLFTEGITLEMSAHVQNPHLDNDIIQATGLQGFVIQEQKHPCKLMPERWDLIFLLLTSQQLKPKGRETLFLWILSFNLTLIHLPYPPTHTHKVPRRYKKEKQSSGFASLELEFPGFPGGSVVKNPPANAGDAGDSGSISESGRSPGEGNGNPFQYSCLGNVMDRGAWQAYSP